MLTLRVRPSQDEAHSARTETQLRHRLTLNPGRGRETLKAGPGLCVGTAINFRSSSSGIRLFGRDGKSLVVT